MKSVNLLFAYKWFYSEQSNKGGKSKLLSNLFEEHKNSESTKQVKTENELMTLCYMSYLETNNFAKINKKFLFGELVKSSSNTVYQE